MVWNEKFKQKPFLIPVPNPWPQFANHNHRANEHPRINHSKRVRLAKMSWCDYANGMENYQFSLV
jgi:hypothetical protein